MTREMLQYRLVYDWKTGNHGRTGLFTDLENLQDRFEQLKANPAIASIEVQEFKTTIKVLTRWRRP